MPLTTARIGVLLGGQSAEREISLKTGQAVLRALLRLGYDVVPIDVDASFLQQLRDKKVEIAFVALHGPGGEDGTIQGLLEMVGIPYTGSGVRASAIAMHKVTAKALLDYYGIPVPPGIVLRSGQGDKASPVPPAGLKWPLVVKPAAQGSTFGVSIVRQVSEWQAALRHAHQYDHEAVIEAYIAGREITVSVLGGSSEEPLALPAIEILAPGGFFDYAAKYEKGRTTYLCPAPLPASVSRQVQNQALRTYQLLGCQGASRVDFRVTKRGKPFVLEINTVPGMTETSLLPMAAAKAGIDYESLTERILQSALRRVKAIGTMKAQGI